MHSTCTLHNYAVKWILVFVKCWAKGRVCYVNLVSFSGGINLLHVFVCPWWIAECLARKREGRWEHNTESNRVICSNVKMMQFYKCLNAWMEQRGVYSRTVSPTTCISTSCVELVSVLFVNGESECKPSFPLAQNLFWKQTCPTKAFFFCLCVFTRKVCENVSFPRASFFFKVTPHLLILWKCWRFVCMQVETCMKNARLKKNLKQQNFRPILSQCFWNPLYIPWLMQRLPVVGLLKEVIPFHCVISCLVWATQSAFMGHSPRTNAGMSSISFRFSKLLTIV